MKSSYRLSQVRSLRELGRGRKHGAAGRRPLRLDGHNVAWVVEMVRGVDDIDDIDVLALTNSLNALLITDDKDFGELVVRQRRPVLGIILLRLEGMSPDDRADLVSRTLTANESALPGAFTVIQRRSVRIRRLQP